MAFLLVKFIPELLYNQWITVTQTFISTPYFHLSLCPIWAWLLVGCGARDFMDRFVLSYGSSFPRSGLFQHGVEVDQG